MLGVAIIKNESVTLLYPPCYFMLILSQNGHIPSSHLVMTTARKNRVCLFFKVSLCVRLLGIIKPIYQIRWIYDKMEMDFSEQ